METLAVKERPILFSTPMVKAMMDYEKDVTRRTRGLDEINKTPDEWELVHVGDYKTTRADGTKYEGYSVLFQHKQGKYVVDVPCPYGRPGDVLWVRETFFKNGDEYIYRADGTCCEQFEQCECSEVGKPKWKPSIHMPREACRQRLTAVSFKVERAHDITEEDAIREGVIKDCDYGTTGYRNYLKPNETVSDISARESFETLWQSINGKESWDSNPWVWRIEFVKL
jgi:hypothetical protein